MPLRVGTCGDYKPFTYRDRSGRYEGFDIDAALDLGAALSTEVCFVATTWTALLDDLLAGKFELAMGGISKNEGRARAARFSDPYFDHGKVPLVRAADRGRFATLASIDMPNVRVAVNPGGTNHLFVGSHLRRAQIVVVDDNLRIPAIIAGGDADVMITDSVEARLAAASNPVLAALDTEPFTREQMAYLVNPHDRALLEAVNGWIARAKNDGTYARLRARWIP